MLRSERGIQFKSFLSRSSVVSLAKFLVRQATEFAVFSLIIEGARQGLWKFADPGLGAGIVQRYEGKYLGIGRGKTPQMQAQLNSDQLEARSPGVMQQSSAQLLSQTQHEAVEESERYGSGGLLPGWYLKVAQTSKIGQKENTIISSLERAGFKTSVDRIDDPFQGQYSILVGPYQSKTPLLNLSSGYGFQMFYNSGAGHNR